MLYKAKKIAGTVTLAIVAIVVTMAFRAKTSNTASKNSTPVTDPKVVTTPTLNSGSEHNTPPDSNTNEYPSGQIRKQPLSNWTNLNANWFNGDDVPLDTGESLTISLYGN